MEDNSHTNQDTQHSQHEDKTPGTSVTVTQVPQEDEIPGASAYVPQVPQEDEIPVTSAYVLQVPQEDEIPGTSAYVPQVPQEDEIPGTSAYVPQVPHGNEIPMTIVFVPQGEVPGTSSNVPQIPHGNGIPRTSAYVPRGDEMPRTSDQLTSKDPKSRKQKSKESKTKHRKRKHKEYDSDQKSKHAQMETVPKKSKTTSESNKPSCCQKQCLRNIEPQVRETLHREYQEELNQGHTQGQEYLCRYISCCEAKKRGKRRNFTYYYHVPRADDGFRDICMKAFTQIFGINEWAVRDARIQGNIVSSL